ncbi:MAG: hypothetical protein AAFX93_12855 [Verrucomicrobiota bacterium]
MSDTASRFSRRQIVLAIIIVVIVFIAGSLFMNWMDDYVGNGYEERIQIISDSMTTALDAYFEENQALPAGDVAMLYWSNQPEFLGNQSVNIVSNMKFLPKTKFDGSGGVPSLRLWLSHLGPRGENDSKQFGYHIDESRTIGLPILWYFYEHPTKGLMVAVTDAGSARANLPRDQFVEYLEASVNFAEKNGLPHEASQLDYARQFE